MSCPQCGSGNTQSFSREHHYCHACGGHEYEDQSIDKRDWERWVNGEAGRPVREEQLDMWGRTA